MSAIVESHIQNIAKGCFDQKHPFFYHPDYVMNFKRVALGRDGYGQDIFDVQFHIVTREGKWDTADVLAYITRIIYYLKSFVECARVAVSYDTATANGGSNHKRYANINIIYVVDIKKMHERKNTFTALEIKHGGSMV